MLYSQSMSRYTEPTMREVAWTEGDVVRKLRIVAEWKLKDLAKQSGVSLTMIHELEMGKTKEAKRSTLTKIAAAFGLTYPELLGLVPTHPVKLEISARPSGEARPPAAKRRRAG